MKSPNHFYLTRMISFLRGTVVEALPTRLILDVGGVGYDLQIALSTYDRLPAPGTSYKILTHLQIREDAHILFGFATPEERDLFLLLVNNVSGIGPKLALSVLNGLTPLQFRSYVVAGDITNLSKLKGLGKKTAERIIVELRDKVGVSAAWEAASAQHGLPPEEQLANDAVLALIALGYKQPDAHKTIRTLRDKQPELNLEELIRQSLKVLSIV